MPEQHRIVHYTENGRDISANISLVVKVSGNSLSTTTQSTVYITSSQAKQLSYFFVRATSEHNKKTSAKL